MLRLEGLAVFAAATVAYWQTGGVWWVYLVLFLWPDLSMLGFMVGSRTGALAYDAVHTYLGPAVLGIAAWFLDQPAALSFAMIWSAHIGLDRLAGYGLRYPGAVHITHLGPKGTRPSPTASPAD
ncbi:MAG TPA: DUF4260 domain-containing protein [Devosiaceae bacterium]|nr:DUF4260 domain-containing protein [Devosiaceae bacterium]